MYTNRIFIIQLVTSMIQCIIQQEKTSLQSKIQQTMSDNPKTKIFKKIGMIDYYPWNPFCILKIEQE